MNPDHRLAVLRRLSDKRVLAGRQVDVRPIDALAHGGDGARAVLAAERQDHDVGLLHNFKGFAEESLIRACLVVTRGIEDLSLRHLRLQHLKKVPAVRLEFS